MNPDASTMTPGTRSGQFRVAAIGENKCTLESYSRRDFYKITLLTSGSAPCTLCYGSLEPIEVDRIALVLTNPVVPLSWTVPEQTVPATGYFCVFDDDFIRSNSQLAGIAGGLFSSQQSPVYFPDAGELKFFTSLFARMRHDSDSDYGDKENLFRSYLSLIFHEVLKMRRPANVATSGHSRIATGFSSLLSRQFPVDLPLHPIRLKKASDFADLLAVHVNHLNAAVRKATGKTTTTHINEQLLAESKSLLSFTDYSVSEIAFGLGFEYQSYFNRFFKKHAGLTPSDYRRNVEKYK